MRNFKIVLALLLTLVALTVVACGKPADKLIGKWGIDEAALADSDEIKKMPEAERKAALEMAKGMMGSLTIEFTADKMTADMMGKKMEGTYKVLSTEGDKVNIEGTMDGKTEKMTILCKGDGLIMDMGKKSVALKRK